MIYTKLPFIRIERVILKTQGILKKKNSFLGNNKMNMKDAWNLRPPHLAPTTYFEAESPAVQALNLLKRFATEFSTDH